MNMRAAIANADGQRAHPPNAPLKPKSSMLTSFAIAATYAAALVNWISKRDFLAVVNGGWRAMPRDLRSTESYRKGDQRMKIEPVAWQVTDDGAATVSYINKTMAGAEVIRRMNRWPQVIYGIRPLYAIPDDMVLVRMSDLKSVMFEYEPPTPDAEKIAAKERIHRAMLEASE